MPDKNRPTLAHVRISKHVSDRLERLRARYPTLETRTALLLFAADVGLQQILGDADARAPGGADRG